MTGAKAATLAKCLSAATSPLVENNVLQIELVKIILHHDAAATGGEPLAKSDRSRGERRPGQAELGPGGGGVQRVEPVGVRLDAVQKLQGPRNHAEVVKQTTRERNRL